jgi:hypothetical protein
MLNFKEFGWKGIATIFIIALVAVAAAPRVFDALKGVRKTIEGKLS